MDLRAAFLGANGVEIVEIEAFVHSDAFKVFVFIIETMKYVEGNGLDKTFCAYASYHIIRCIQWPRSLTLSIQEMTGRTTEFGYAAYHMLCPYIVLPVKYRKK